jgi:hypothetical protein
MPPGEYAAADAAAVLRAIPGHVDATRIHNGRWASCFISSGRRDLYMISPSGGTREHCQRSGCND